MLDRLTVESMEERRSGADTDGGQHSKARRNGLGTDVSTLRHGGMERTLTLDSTDGWRPLNETGGAQASAQTIESASPSTQNQRTMCDCFTAQIPWHDVIRGELFPPQSATVHQ